MEEDRRGGACELFTAGPGAMVESVVEGWAVGWPIHRTQTMATEGSAEGKTAACDEHPRSTQSTFVFNIDSEGEARGTRGAGAVGFSP